MPGSCIRLSTVASYPQRRGVKLSVMTSGRQISDTLVVSNPAKLAHISTPWTGRNAALGSAAAIRVENHLV